MMSDCLRGDGSHNARAHGVLRLVPNAISVARILATPVLVGMAAVGNEAVFTWVLVPALLSDIADGLIARVFHLQSKLGALLDSVADTLLLFVSIYGIWVFHREVIELHAMECAVMVGAWLMENIASLLR